MQVHIFKYSKRKGTVAEKLPDQVPEDVKDKRSDLMIALGEKMKKEFYDSYSGKEAEILIERKMKNGKYHGTTANYMDVYIESNDDISGQFIKTTL